MIQDALDQRRLPDAAAGRGGVARHRSSLREILDSDALRSFVVPLENRLATDVRCQEWGLLASGWGVVALADLERVCAELESSLADTPFPEACAGCPKMDGW